VHSHVFELSALAFSKKIDLLNFFFVTGGSFVNHFSYLSLDLTASK